MHDKKKGCDIEFTILDYEGVVGPSSMTLARGKLMMDRRLEFLSNKTGVPMSDIKGFSKELLDAYNTDSIGYALQMKYGIPVSEFIAYVFEPEIPRIRKEIETMRDPAQIALIASLKTELAILSNTATIYVQTGLEAQGLATYFKYVIGMESLATAGFSKPQLGAYTEILRIIKGTADKALYADDNPKNLVMPKRLGMTTVYIGEQNVEKYDATIDYKFPSLNEAVNALRS
ncbi:MAG TPA: HAD hydrolase-like protein [Candidatus Saccharimonadales bacterium]|nr:HAD hydrolase-like protein [Candidatus Saccharimonadales bacterium]